MPELATDFQSLPDEYQQVILLAQERHNITITPLQELAGGWSGALIQLVSIARGDTGQIQHLILKLDRRNPSSKSDEVTRHNAVLSTSPPDFSRDHIARIAFERVEHGDAIGIFYDIAGQSLRNYLPLSRYERQGQLKTLFAATDILLLTEWNAGRAFEQSVHPQKLLEKWLGFRLQPDGNIERFFSTFLRIHPEIQGFLIDGDVVPNPLAYARNAGLWGAVRPIDVMLGLIHGDLNTNNILARFSQDARTLDGYYLIDFALFKERMPLLYDQRYLEISYLILSMSQVSFEKCLQLMVRLAEVDILDPQLAPLEMAGAAAVIASARGMFDSWIREHHPSLQDDLWGQYWLAGVAAGLSYCHKAGQPDEQRLAGLIFASANLKRYAALFGVPVPTEVVQLYSAGQIGAGSQRYSGLRTTQVARAQNNLPAQSTTFVGREQEISRTREMLLHRPDVRIITLTGPGGTGKTRLSLEIASGLLDAFEHGVFLVSLADVREPTVVISRIAQQLEVRDAGSQPLLENLKDYLRDRNILFILDNFEQLVSEALIVADLIAAAPGLKVLVTSRIRLHLRGENEFPIQPLPTPDPDELPSLGKLGHNESVRLFVERAQAAQPAFLLTEANAPAVARLCQRLDGLPLAIELAAARAKLLAPDAILARLDDRFKLLAGGARDLPARQRTLRDTLKWSCDLLNQEEKTLYARLSVFVGGFTLEAAEAVCNPDGTLDVMEAMASLVNNSLMQQETTKRGQAHFGMLETIREYAAELLESHGEQAALQRAHAQYYANMLISDAVGGLTGAEATDWLDKIEVEHGNIQAALTWSQTTPEGQQLGPPLALTLTWFWYRRGFFNEGRMWTERILASPAAQKSGEDRAMALEANAMIAMWQGDIQLASAQALESLSLWQRLENEQRVPPALMETGVVLLNMGRDREAHALLAEAQALFKDGGEIYRHAICLVHLGNVALGLGNPDEASGWLDQAHLLFQDIGEEWGLSFVLNNLGEVARVRGDYDTARQHYTESEALLRATGDKGDLARLIHSLGYIALHQAEYQQAELKFMESLSMFRKLGNKRGIAECLAGLSGLRAREGRVQWAATMLGAAEALLGASGAAWWPADRVELEQNRGIMQSTLGADEYASAREAGKSMTLEQAIAFALDGS